MSDSLTALSNAVRSSLSITFTNGGEPCTSLSEASHIEIAPSHTFTKSTSTRFKSFSLEALYLAWLHRHAPSAEYMKLVRESGVLTGFVGVTERKGVVELLESGDFSKLPDIEHTTPPGSPSGTHKTALAASGVESSNKRRYVSDTHDIEVVKKIKLQEIELKDRTSVLRGKPNNFTNVHTFYTEKLKRLKDSKSGSTSTIPASVSDSSKLSLQAKKAKNSYPIIMISSSPTALITMYNVRKFLQESSFEPSQDARTRANTRPEDMIPIYRKLTSIDAGGRESSVQAKYFIVDSTEALSKFGPDAWDRVVCVMTTGQLWQFRPYKWSEPKVLFHHVKGVYISWATEPPNSKIKDWNVTELKIDPHRRHVDKSVVAGFWKTLDSWMLANKQWLVKT